MNHTVLSTCTPTEIESVLGDNPNIDDIIFALKKEQHAKNLAKRKQRLEDRLATAHPLLRAAFERPLIELHNYEVRNIFDGDGNKLERLATTTFLLLELPGWRSEEGTVVIELSESMGKDGVPDPAYTHYSIAYEDGKGLLEYEGGDGMRQEGRIVANSWATGLEYTLCEEHGLDYGMEAMSSMVEVLTDCDVDEERFYRSVQGNDGLYLRELNRT
ncbi:hypothetical protein HDV00_006439 [Rhizophlyctis rosea]|nr:hypothetical protein HDV00_006439 [Rhizophlyctis rosea]